MKESNGTQAPSQGPDFRTAFTEAQSSGDFGFVLQTAKDSEKMLRDFKQAVQSASFFGRDVRAVAMGLEMLGNMVIQAANQVEQIKRSEKMTREAMKATQRTQTVVGLDDSIEPEAPAAPPVSHPDPTASVPAEPPAPAVDDQDGWSEDPNVAR